MEYLSAKPMLPTVQIIVASLLTWEMLWLGLIVIRTVRMPRRAYLNLIAVALLLTGVTAARGTIDGDPSPWLIAAISALPLQIAIAARPGPTLTFDAHFREAHDAISNPFIRKSILNGSGTVNRSKSDRRSLFLKVLDAGPTGLTLYYRCYARITPEQADAVDTRLRAYVTCAIFDAAKLSGLKVVAGPHFGQRPGWVLNGTHFVSLREATFEQCRLGWVFYLNIGQVMVPGQIVQMEPCMQNPLYKTLSRGFLRRFQILRI